MSIKDTLHYASHLKWAFLTAVITLIIYAFVALPENLISIIGTIIFLAGIQMGLESLSDIERMSEKEKTFYANRKYVKTQNLILFSVIIVVVTISLLFLSLKFVFPSKASFFNAFFDLGLDCWAFILGLLCLLKSTHDKHSIAVEKAPAK